MAPNIQAFLFFGDKAHNIYDGKYLLNYQAFSGENPYSTKVRSDTMGKKKRIPENNLGIPAYQMESLARALLPIRQEYLSSEEGKEEYNSWKKKKEQQKEITDSINASA